MVFFFSALRSYSTLCWTRAPPKFRPLPAFVERTMIPSRDGKGELEMLICPPSKSESSSHITHPPIFFIHGGYGSAGVWLEWMTYLHNAGYPGTLYAFSARNHGASYSLPFWKMVWFTSFNDIQSDALTCLTYANKREQTLNSLSRPAILVGHSSGGGLAQSLLATSQTRTSGLALIDAIPHFGCLDIYWNWIKHDPWFPLRTSFHLQHPTSPLSTDELVHSAFFSRASPTALASSFRSWMPPYETMDWPIDMIGDGILEWISGTNGPDANTWLKCEDIVNGIDNITSKTQSDKVCILIGTEDIMYRPAIYKRQVREYANALSSSSSSSVAAATAGSDSKDTAPAIENVSVERFDGGIRLILVEKSGHHVQNDVARDQAAEALLRWVRQV